MADYLIKPVMVLKLDDNSRLRSVYDGFPESIKRKHKKKLDEFMDRKKDVLLVAGEDFSEDLFLTRATSDKGVIYTFKAVSREMVKAPEGWNDWKPEDKKAFVENLIEDEEYSSGWTDLNAELNAEHLIAIQVSAQKNVI